MSMLKKTLIYLGLGPDEEYDAFDDYAPDAAAPTRPNVRAVAEPEPVMRPSGTVRPIGAPRPEPATSVRVVAPVAEPAPAPQVEPAGTAEPVNSAVRIVDSTAVASPHATAPTTFNEAQAIGDRFKAGQPVIVNLQGADRDLRRRLVDFASGLCYALTGKMERVADQVYLLTPADVEIPASDRRAFD